MDEEIQKALGKQEQESRFFMPDEFYEQHTGAEEDTKKAAIQSLIQPVARNVPSFMEEREVSDQNHPPVLGNDPALIGHGNNSFDTFSNPATISEVPYTPFSGTADSFGGPSLSGFQDSETIDTSGFMPQAAPTPEMESSFANVNEVPFVGNEAAESSYGVPDVFPPAMNSSGEGTYSAMPSESFVNPSSSPVPSDPFSNSLVPQADEVPLSSTADFSTPTETVAPSVMDGEQVLDQNNASFGIEPSFPDFSNLSAHTKETFPSGLENSSGRTVAPADMESTNVSVETGNSSFSTPVESTKDVSDPYSEGNPSTFVPSFSGNPQASVEPSFSAPPVPSANIDVAPPVTAVENVVPEAVMPSFVAPSDSTRDSSLTPSFDSNDPVNMPSSVPISATSDSMTDPVHDPAIAQAYREQATEGILTNPFISEESPDSQSYKAGSDVNLVEEPYTEDGLFVQPEEETVATKTSRSAIQNWINKILRIPSLDPVKVDLNPSVSSSTENISSVPPAMEEESVDYQEPTISNEDEQNIPQFEEVKVDYDHLPADLPVVKSTLLEQLRKKSEETSTISILARYGEDFCAKDYVTNPAIGRSDEIRQLILILLTPEKSGILTGKPGIGKTSIVEGLAFQLQRNHVPEALKGYTIISVKTPSLLGSLPTGETRLQTLVDELKDLDKVILFIDEIHMLIGATNESALDFANMFKEALGRGKIKVIGATTTEEYERYILRDKAFVRRFQKVEVEEPNRDLTVQIMMGTLPKLELETGAKMKYTAFQQGQIMGFIVDITSEYRRIYGIGSRYPDICLTLLAQAFSHAVFENRTEVNIFDIRSAIENSKNIYPDVIQKELPNFDIKFKDMIAEEMGKSQT